LEFIPKVDLNVALNDLDAARQHIRAAGAAKIGAVGFCWGGTLAWLLACRREVDCAVAYYGSEIDDFPNEHARHPVIMHIGDADRTIPPDKLARIKEAQALYERTGIDLDDTTRHIELEVRTAYSNFREADEVLKSQEKVVEQAQEAVRLATSRYEAGTGTQLDVLNTQTTLTKARTTQIQTLQDYEVARARLERAVGEIVPEQRTGR